MSDLLTSVVAIRGVNYEVSEIDGKTMREVRKRLKDTPETVEAFLSFKCSVKPAFASENEAAAASHLVLKMISEEAFRLSTTEDAAKNA